LTQQNQLETAKPSGDRLADVRRAAMNFNRAWWRLLWGMSNGGKAA
jgi:hypothetical protein